MSGDGASPSRNARLRREAEGKLSERPSEGGIWYSVADCQRMVHELQVYKIELDLIDDELEAHNRDMHAWGEKAARVQRELLDAAKRLELLKDGAGENSIAIQCLEATLRLFEGRIKMLTQDGGTESR